MNKSVYSIGTEEAQCSVLSACFRGGGKAEMYPDEKDFSTYIPTMLNLTG
jgi:hypothetical protein